MAAFNKFNDFTEQLARGVHDWDAHTFKVMLTNVAPVATNSVKADLTEISAGSGYSAGGTATTITISETGGTTTVNGTQVVFTASGTMAAFRYAVLYNDTATSPADALVGWWDYASSVTLQDTETFTVKFSNTTPGAIFTLA